MKIYYYYGALATTVVLNCTTTISAVFAANSASATAAASNADADADLADDDIASTTTAMTTKVEMNHDDDNNHDNNNNEQNLSLLFYSNHHHLHNDYQKVLEKFAVQANKDLNEKMMMTKKKNGGGNGNGGATQNIGNEDHNRMLQSLTQFEFDNYFCDLFEVEFGARCSCDAGSLTMKCDLGEECMAYPSTFFPEGTATDCPAGDANENGSGGEVCFDTSMMMKLSQVGGTLDIDSFEMVIVYTGMDYSAERLIMWPTSALGGMSNSKCEMYYSIDDLEYKCNSCQTCSTGEEVTFDCSNISPDFSAVCINVNNMDAVNDLKFDYCPVGGAPQPTTPSVGPASKPITVGSGSSSGSSSSSGISIDSSSSSSFIRSIIIVPVVASIVVTAAVACI